MIKQSKIAFSIFQCLIRMLLLLTVATLISFVFQIVGFPETNIVIKRQPVK